MAGDFRGESCALSTGIEVAQVRSAFARIVQLELSDSVFAKIYRAHSPLRRAMHPSVFSVKCFAKVEIGDICQVGIVPPRSSRSSMRSVVKTLLALSFGMDLPGFAP